MSKSFPICTHGDIAVPQDECPVHGDGIGPYPWRSARVFGWCALIFLTILASAVFWAAVLR